MSEKVEISVLVPVRNEEKYLPKFHDGMLHELKKLEKPFEIVYVDNDSDDESLPVLRKLKEMGSEPVRVIQLRRRFARGLLLAAGLQHCQGENVVVVPATGEIPANAWPRLLEDLAGVDFVQGRQPDRSLPLAQWPANWVHNHVLSPACGVRLQDMYCHGFAARREILNRLLPVPAGLERFIGLAAQRQGCQVRESILACNAFVDEDASFLRGCVQGIFDFLYVVRGGAWLFGPLRAFAAVGIFFLVLAVLAGIGSLVQYLFCGLANNNGTLLCLEITLGLVFLSIISLVAGTAAEAARLNADPKPDDCIDRVD